MQPPAVAAVSRLMPPSAPPLVRLSPEEEPLFEDDLDSASLRAAAEESARYFHSLPPSQTFILAQDTYSARDLAQSMETLTSLLDESRSKQEWLSAVAKNFQVYQSLGSDGRGTVSFSSYYEPTIPARLAPDKTYRFPIYARPTDLINVDLGLFGAAWQGARIAGRRRGRGLVPYFTREDIDAHGILAGEKLEIAWAKDPLDIFFLQIEGSGWLDLGRGPPPVRIRYDGDNGRPYRSVGRYMIESGLVKAHGFGHAQLVRYMKKHPRRRQSILDIDERYIFFRIDTSTQSAYAYGNIDAPLTPGRSIATDPRLFPKGLLAWIEVPRGRKAKGLKRFVLNQDEGGAIQGPARVDLFAGHGKAAENLATHFWYPGKLYFLVKKR